MQKLKWLLGSQKRQPEPGLPAVTNPTQPITHTSQPSPTDNPPSYEQAQFNHLQNDLQSLPNNPSPPLAQLSNPERYTTEEAPNYASSQATQAHHHQADEKQNPPLAEDADALALLRENGWPTRNQAERNSALYWAATNGHAAAVRYLMRNGASGVSNTAGLTRHTGSPNSALASAAAANHVGIVSLLLEQATEGVLGCDSALRDAARGGHVEVVRVLLGRWPKRGGSYEYSRAGALGCAAERGCEEVVRVILDGDVELGVPLHMAERAALCRAAGAGEAGIVKLLLDQMKGFASMEFVVEVALSNAVDRGHAGIVRMLLDLGVVRDFEMAMFAAVQRGDVAVLRLLLAAGARAHPTLALDEAVDKGDHSMVQLLLEYGADATNALNPAAISGESSIVRLLLDHGAAVNVLDERKRAPLHVAASQGRREVAELFLGRGADIAAQDGEGRTPLYLAVVSRQQTTVGLLLEHGAATRSVREGNTMQKAFVEAVIDGAENGAMDGATKVMQLLINHGFHFNFGTGSDSKLLGLVAGKGFRDMVLLLLGNGADVEGQDNRGRTALHLAAMNGNHEIVKLLLEKGADPTVLNRSE